MREAARERKRIVGVRRTAFFARVAAALTLLPFAFLLLPSARAQEVVDRMVAVVNERELITYSDLLWQLALQPDVPLDNPRREDLRRALDLLTDQRLILEEAEKLPSAAPTDQEIQDEEKRVISFFPSMSAFYDRLSRVGIGSDSSQLQTRWTLCASFGTKPHFTPVAKPAPPRPRRFEALTSFVMSSGRIASALRSAL